MVYFSMRCDAQYIQSANYSGDRITCENTGYLMSRGFKNQNTSPRAALGAVVLQQARNTGTKKVNAGRRRSSAESLAGIADQQRAEHLTLLPRVSEKL